MYNQTHEKTETETEKHVCECEQYGNMLYATCCYLLYYVQLGSGLEIEIRIYLQSSESASENESSDAHVRAQPTPALVHCGTGFPPDR